MNEETANLIEVTEEIDEYSDFEPVEENAITATENLEEDRDISSLIESMQIFDGPSRYAYSNFDAMSDVSEYEPPQFMTNPLHEEVVKLILELFPVTSSNEVMPNGDVASGLNILKYLSLHPEHKDSEKSPVWQMLKSLLHNKEV